MASMPVTMAAPPTPAAAKPPLAGLGPAAKPPCFCAELISYLLKSMSHFEQR